MRYRVIKEGTACCSNRCATLLRMEQGFEPGYSGWKKRSGYRTDIEAMAEEALKKLKIPYLFEHKIGRYMVDFLLPFLGVALECDGWQHQTAKCRARDAERDKAIEAKGWRVVRIPDKAIRTDTLKAIKAALQPPCHAKAQS